MNAEAVRTRRALVAVIAAISVVGLSLGLSIPLVSLALERRGVDSTLIGLMGAMPAFGILCCSPLIPALVGRIGLRGTLYGAIVLGGSVVLALPFWDHYGVWLLLRFLMGVANTALFVLSETWINQLAAERSRGRLVAIYATVLALCFASGPVLIAVVGAEGARPFVVSAIVLYAAGLPLIWVGTAAPRLGGKAGFGVIGFLRIAPVLCGAVLLFSFFDGAVMALLPVFGLRHGYPEGGAALMLSALVAGNTALQIPLGWLADRINRRRLLFACAIGSFTAVLILPLVVRSEWLVWPVLVLLGGLTGGIYTLALTLLGERFRDADLVAANATFGLLWGVGTLAGPLVGGFGMRLVDPDGLPLTLALAAAVFLVLFLHRQG